MVGKTEIVYPSNEAAQFVQIKNAAGGNVDLPTAGPNGLPVDTLSALGTPRSIAIGASSTNLALTTTCRRISIYSTVAAFYQVGVGAQTATTSTHFIGPGERLDLDVAASSQIAVIQFSASGTLYITELTAP